MNGKNYIKVLFASLVVSVGDLNAATIEDSLIAYLESLNKADDVSNVLANETAISPFVSEQRKERLIVNLTHICKAIDHSKGEIDIVESKFEGQLGAAIVSVGDMAFPNSLRMLPFALVLQDDKWIPAPLLGSFSNTNLSFHSEVRQSANNLENWMGSRAASLLSERRIKAEEIFLEEARKEAANKFEIENESINVLERFLYLCREQQAARVAYYLDRDFLKNKKLSDQYSEQVTNRLRDKSKDTAWYFLTNKNVVALPLTMSEGVVTVGFFDSSSRFKLTFNAIEVNADPLSDRKKHWEIVPDEAFNNTAEDFVDSGIDDPVFETDFIEALRDKYPFSPSSSLTFLNQGVQAAHEAKDFLTFIRLWKNIEDVDTLNFIRESWMTILDSKLENLKVIEDGDVGAVLISGTKHLYAEKIDGEWSLCRNWTALNGGGLFNPVRAQRARVSSEIATMKKNLIADEKQENAIVFAKLTPESQLSPIAEENVGELTMQWLQARINGQEDFYVNQSLSIFNPDKFAQLAEIHKKRGDEELNLLSSYVEGNWGVSCVELSGVNGGVSDYIVVCATTVNGEERVIADIDIQLPNNKGRKILNDKEFEDIKNHLMDREGLQLVELCKKALLDAESDRQLKLK